MSMRTKAMMGWSGNESDTGGRESDITLVYDAWATTRAERVDTNYISNAISAINANTPPNVGNLRRKSHRWREDEDTGHLVFDVLYGADQIAEAEIRWSFDTLGGTIKVFTSKATASFPAGAPDHQNAIDVDDDGDVQGVDVVIPALKLTARKRFSSASAIYGPQTFQNYIKTLAAYTGQTNSTTYQTYAAGELLFLGASGEFQEGKDNEIEFHWAASGNAIITIGSIASVAKKGHDFVWISYKHHVDGTGKRSRRPKYAYVERLYGEFDFASVIG